MPSESHGAPSRRLHVALWIGQVLLAFIFGGSGLMKVLAPWDTIAQNMGAMAMLPPAMVRGIGAAEVAGAVGLLLPTLLRIQPWLTSLASACCALVMALAIPFHLMHAEAGHVPGTALIGALAVWVAWGRAKGAPVASRASARPLPFPPSP